MLHEIIGDRPEAFGACFLEAHWVSTASPARSLDRLRTEMGLKRTSGGSFCGSESEQDYRMPRYGEAQTWEQTGHYRRKVFRRRWQKREASFNSIPRMIRVAIA